MCLGPSDVPGALRQALRCAWVPQMCLGASDGHCGGHCGQFSGTTLARNGGLLVVKALLGCLGVLNWAAHRKPRLRP